ncbi:MAG: hypothetical protein KKG75_02345 [Nanoarchaeota archaeon]|nr:hypothetical protein [Nanoarchaeota archaeon]
MKEIEKEIKKFKKDVSEDYVKNRIVDKITKSYAVNNTDGSFIQIPIKIKIEREWFEEENYFNGFGFLGENIAMRETNFLIKKILELKSPIKCKNKKEIKRKIYSFLKDDIITGSGEEDLLIRFIKTLVINSSEL